MSWRSRPESSTRSSTAEFVVKNRGRRSMRCAWGAKRCLFPHRKRSAKSDGNALRLRVHCGGRLSGFVYTAMPEPKKIAIITALSREVWPLIKNGREMKTSYEGREFTFYESDYAVAVCGGIGGEHARRAAEAIIGTYCPQVLISAGIAGALVPDLHVGDTVFPTTVIDVKDGSRHETAIRNSPMAKTSLG